MYKPTRMCAVCRARKHKEELIRVVRTPSGEYALDRSGVQDGRGAYVCANTKCIEQCVRKRTLNHFFKDNLPEEIYEALARECQKD